MSNSVSLLYTELATNAGPLDELIAAQIMQWAKDNHDTELGARLIVRADITGKTLTELLTWDAAEVRIAYLRRPGITEASMRDLLRKEKRVTVLSAAAASETCPAAILDELSTLENPGVAIAVAANEHTSLAARKRALSFISSTDKQVSYAVAIAADNIVLATPSLHDWAALNLRSQALQSKLLRSDRLSEAAQLHLYGVLVEEIDPKMLYKKLSNAVALAENPVIAKTVYEKLCVIRDTTATALGGTQWNAQLTKSLALNAPTEDGDKTRELLRIARNSTDYKELAGMVDMLMDAGAYQDTTTQSLFEALLSNYTVRDEDTARFVRFANGQVVSKYVGERSKNGPNFEIVLIIAITNTLVRLLRVMLGHVDDIATTTAGIVAWAEQEHRPDAQRELIKAGTELTDAQLLTFDFTVLCEPGNITVLRIADIIANRLGTRPELWASFHTLGPTFAGSFAQLLDVCDASVAA